MTIRESRYVIPVYNRIDVLKPVVDSILGQTLPVAEVILIDDGSTVHGPSDVERLIQESNGWAARVKYIYKSNAGQSAALNDGIAMAQGDWVGFNGHDDMWLPWKLEWQFRALRKYRCGLCFTDAWFMNNPHMKASLFDGSGLKLGEAIGIIDDPALFVAGSHPIWTQTAVARTDLVREIGGFDASLRYSEDHEFLFRMALATKFCYVSLPMTLIDRSPAEQRHVGASVNWHKEEFRLQADQYRFERQLELGSRLPNGVQELIRGNLRTVHSAWANWYLAGGQYDKARKAISTAIRYDATLAVRAKGILLKISPWLTKRLLSIRDIRAEPRYDRISWKTEDVASPDPGSAEPAQTSLNKTPQAADEQPLGKS